MLFWIQSLSGFLEELGLAKPQNKLHQFEHLSLVAYVVNTAKNDGLTTWIWTYVDAQKG